MNKKHLKNLAKLADFLETKITDAQFDISGFRLKEIDGTPCDYKAKNDCGSVGCAIGWAPFLFKPLSSEMKRGWEPKSLNFRKFCARVFGVGPDDGEIGSYMFSSEWQFLSGQTRKATIARIREVTSLGGELTEEMIRTIHNLRL